MRYAVGSRLRRGRRWARQRQAVALETIDRHRRPAVRSACYAAHSALYFRPDGQVQVCCATGFVVGSLTGENRSTLRGLWAGEGVAEHRRWLEADRFGLGCQECEVAIEAGGRPAALASHFDRWRLKAPYEYPKLLDFALSSRCNLQCVMCNGELSSAIRTQREGRPPMPAAYDDVFFEELAEFLPHAERVQFKGGEPFLAPENRRVWDLMIEQGSTAEVTITTNGTVWNDDVERYLRALRAEPNISIDGTTAEVFEGIRVGAGFDRVWSNVERFQTVAAESGHVVTLSYCFMTTNWQQLPDFLLEVQDRDLSCYVIMVNQPDEFDVLKRPADEVAEILRILEARAPKLTLARPLEEWNRILGRLRTHLEHPMPWQVEVVRPQPVPVQIAPRQPEPEPEPEPVDIDAVRADLVAGGAVLPLVEVVVRDGVVAEVAPQAWSRPLALDRWIGVADTDLSMLLAEIGGSPPVVTIVDGPVAGVTEALVGWPDHVLIPGFRVLVIPTPSEPAGAESDQRWFIVPALAGDHDR